MQINMAHYNANLRAVATPLNTTTQRQPAKASARNVFGAQCKVTISNEGRRLSEQSKQQQAQSIQASKMERVLIRQQEHAEANKTEYTDKVNAILNEIKDAKNNFSATETKETIEEKQEALRKMMEQKELQDEKNKKKIAEAESALSLSAKQQREIDEMNADLYVMVKSFEDPEAEENGKEHSDNSEKDSEDSRGGVGTEVQASASALGVSAARSELYVNGIVDGMENEGLDLLARADAIYNEAYMAIKDAVDIVEDPTLSAEEKEQKLEEYVANGGNLANTADMGEAARLRGLGFQKRRDAKELDTKHIVINPLDGVAEAQKTIMDIGVDAAFHEAAQGMLDDASQELKDRVQEEIDKQNNITGTPDEELEEEQSTEKLEQEKLEQEKLEQEKLEKEELEQKPSDEASDTDKETNEPSSQIIDGQYIAQQDALDGKIIVQDSHKV